MLNLFGRSAETGATDILWTNMRQVNMQSIILREAAKEKGKNLFLVVRSLRGGGEGKGKTIR